MAEENRRIIEIDAQESIRTLRVLQEELNATKNALTGVDGKQKDIDKTSIEYQQNLVKLKAAQTEYNRELRLSAKEAVSAKGSYNDLNNQLARLKEEWKQVTPNTEAYDKITQKVNEVKKQLETMDHDIGNYQRNVGNYTSAWAGMPGPLGKVAGGIKNVTTAAKAFIATPLGAILTAISVVLGAIIKGFKSSEENLNALTMAMSPFKSIGQAVTIVCQNLAKAIGAVANKLTKWLDSLGLLTDKMKENQEIAKLEIELRKKERDVLVENARLEMEAEKAKTEAKDKANLSTKERLALLQSAADKEKQIMKNELAVAQMQYDIALRKKDLTDNSIEANDALAEAQANLYNVQARYEQGMSRITSQMSSAMIELRGQVKTTTEEVVQMTAILDEWFDKMDVGIAARMQAQKDAAAEQADIDKWLAEQEAQATAATKDAMNSYWEEQQRNLDMQKNSYKAYASAVKSVLSSVTGAWEDAINAQVEAGNISQEEAQKQFEVVKGFQYAQTLINTASGIMSALAAPDLLPAAKWANAIAVGVEGAAQAVTIANTKMGSTASKAASVARAMTSATNTSAPSISQSVPMSRFVTTAQDEQTLNALYGAQRVYILNSDLEAASNARKVKAVETSF